MKRLLSVLMSAWLMATALIVTSATPAFAYYYTTCDSSDTNAIWHQHRASDNNGSLHYWAARGEIENYYDAHACLNGSGYTTNPLSVTCPANLQGNVGFDNTVQLCVGAVHGKGVHYWYGFDTNLRSVADLGYTEPRILAGDDMILEVWERTFGDCPNYGASWHFYINNVTSGQLLEFDQCVSIDSNTWAPEAWWGIEATNKQSQIGGQNVQQRIYNLGYRYRGDNGTWTYATGGSSGSWAQDAQDPHPSYWFGTVGTRSTYYQGRFWDFDYIGAWTCDRPC